MVTVGEIYDIIDNVAPFDTAMSFDNVGILVGDRETKVTKALIALDITMAVVEEAEKIGAELIISHHPIIFTPVKAISLHSPLYLMINKGISAICCHTNLDIAENIGVNAVLCKVLGLYNMEKLHEVGDAGEINYTVASDFAVKIKEAIGANTISFTNPEKIIKKVAVCCGSGGDLVFSSAGKYDALVTGEAKHHELLFAKENDLSIFVAGHYDTEKIFQYEFKKYLTDNLSKVQFVLSLDETNPTVSV